MRLLVAVVVIASLVMAGRMVATVPASAYVVPTVRIATATDPVVLRPDHIGARRTDGGFRWDQTRLDAVVHGLAERFTRSPEPGGYELAEDGVRLRPGAPGVELDVEAAKAAILDAFRRGHSGSPLPLRDVPAPAPPSHAIVVKLSDFRLELYEGPRRVQHYIVGVGQLRFPTPPGAYHVKSKAENPTWRNPYSGWSRNMPAYIPPGPRNPLGTRALRLDRGALVIHGTPQPWTVGRRSSHGCVRMKREDVEALFDMVPVGTPVFMVP